MGIRARENHEGHKALQGHKARQVQKGQESSLAAEAQRAQSRRQSTAQEGIEEKAQKRTVGQKHEACTSRLRTPIRVLPPLSVSNNSGSVLSAMNGSMASSPQREDSYGKTLLLARAAPFCPQQFWLRPRGKVPRLPCVIRGSPPESIRCDRCLRPAGAHAHPRGWVSAWRPDGRVRPRRATGFFPIRLSVPSDAILDVRPALPVGDDREGLRWECPELKKRETFQVLEYATAVLDNKTLPLPPP